MKKNLSIIILTIVLVILIALIFWWNKPAQATIDYYSAIIDIDSAGNITVTETVTLDYDDGFNERWRDIKYSKNNESSAVHKNDKSSLEYAKIISVYKDGLDVTHKINTGYSYENDVDKFGDSIKCDPYAEECESLYIDATSVDGLDGEVVVTYEYKINGMITQYNDTSVLDYRLFEYLEGKIKKAYVAIYLPAISSGYQENDFYSYMHGIEDYSIEQSVTKKDVVNQPDFLFEGTNVKKDNMFEIRVLMPNKVFKNIDDSHKVDADVLESFTTYENELLTEAKKRANIKTVINIVTWLVGVTTLIAIVVVYKKYDKEYESPFEGEYYRELPSDLLPAHMSYLYYFGETIDEDVTATMLNLIRKGVLILDENGSSLDDDDPDYILHYCGDDEKFRDLSEHEQVVVNWFICTVGNGKKVSFEEIKEYPKTDYYKAKRFQEEAKDFKDTVKRECRSFDFFEKGLSKAKAKVASYGVILIILGLVLMMIAMNYNVSVPINLCVIFGFSVIYLLYVGAIKKRSYKGNEEYTKWKAFKKFLEDFSSFEDYPIPSIVIWEEYLPYATSLKIADKVMEQLKVKLPNINEEEQVTYMNTFYYHRRRRHFIHMMNHSLATARFNAAGTIAMHNASKVSGGGRGGFGGGGSFGGGGGGSRVR